jgi:NodT family efflux transporter outer membrane factor (OMF) lipoprotein
MDDGLLSVVPGNAGALGSRYGHLPTPVPPRRRTIGGFGVLRQITGLASLAAVATLLSACSVGPDFLRPSPPKDAGYTPTPLPKATTAAAIQGGDAQRFIEGGDIRFDWWTVFQSPALNALVEKAILANPTIEAAQRALAAAEENVYAQQGYFYPTVTAGYQFQRQMVAGNLASSVAPGCQGNGHCINAFQSTSAPYNKALYYNFHTAQVTVGYTPDVFGLNRRQVESLEAQTEMQRYELEATYITLAANVVAAAVQEVSVRAQIQAVKEIIDVNVKGLELLRLQQKDGYAMGIDVAAQEAALAAARQMLPPLQAQFEQTRDLIRALVGNLPNEDVSETFELSSLHLPQDLPVSIPSKLVEQRPDVRAAEEQIRAANAQVGVAIANRLPLFSITAAAGGTATEFDQMFSPGGPFWSIIGSVTTPVFDGGTLRHRERAADEALYQAAAQYRSTVITAYQNVADTLHALVSDADALSAALDAERAAKKTLDLTRAQMQKGYVDYLVLLQAEQAYQQALLSLVQAQAQRFGDTAALFEALGGGWWNRTGEGAKVSETAPEEKQHSSVQ